MNDDLCCAAGVGTNHFEHLHAKMDQSVADPIHPAEHEAPSNKRARDGMRYVGRHIPGDLWEHLRVVAFETRREKQDPMREGLE